ncbi:MAG: SAM-dependent methyltransferase [Oscillospiraceae bacterium]|nr:SAM-dependent methyltransferase [Oscillospiraceae bacterium]
MIPISARLLCCASMVKGDYVCDIGTDHALLPVYLIRSGRCSRVLATDVKQGPLQAAAQTLKRYDLLDTIQLCLSDGLAKVPDAGITDLVIAGMGGETIRDILSSSKAKWVQRGTNLVLQPMTKAELLRSWLAENGFAITREAAVRDVHLYTVMQACYTGQPRTLTGVEAYVGKLNIAEPLTRIYISIVLERLGKRLDGLTTSGADEDAADVRALIDGINQWMQP